jgi:hypothetical protein
MEGMWAVELDSLDLYLNVAIYGLCDFGQGEVL